MITRQTEEALEKVETLGSVRVSRIEKGLAVEANSPIIGKFFRELRDRHEPRLSVEGWGGLEIWKIKEDKLPKVNGINFANPGGPMFNPQTFELNATLLLSTALETGVRLEVEGVFTNAYREHVLLGLERAMKEVYADHLRPFNKRVILLTKEEG